MDMETVKKLIVVLTAVGVINCSYSRLFCPDHTIINLTRLYKAVAKIINDYYTTESSYFHVIKSVNNSNLNVFNDILSGVLQNILFTEIATEIEDYSELKKMKDRKRFSVIIFVDSIKSFNKFRSKLSYDKFKLRRFFTVVLIKTLELFELEIILESFWNTFVKNVNIVMPSKTGEIHLYTFVLFNERKCEDTKPVKINTFDNIHLNWSNKNIHPKKTQNLHGCLLIIGAAVGSAEPYLMVRKDSNGYEELYGVERTIFEELSMKLNFKPKYEIHGNYPGQIFLNGSAEGLMKKVVDGEVDVIIGFISLQYFRTLHLSETKSYAMIPMVIVVPPGPEYNAIEKFVRPFEAKVWIIICVIFFIGFFIITISRFSELVYNFVIGRGVKTPLSNMIAVSYGVPQTKLPNRNFARFVLMVYVLYCLIIRTAYQGGIYKILKSNERKPEIASVKELIEKNYAFYLYETLAPRTKNFNFYQSSIVFPNNDIGMYRLKTLNPNFKGVVFNYLDQILYLNSLNYKNYTFNIGKERFLTNPFVFYFKKKPLLG